MLKSPTLADLERGALLEAVTEGVSRAFRDALTKDGHFDLPHELLCEAVREGVAGAVWRVATNATDMPSADFFASIEEGAAEGVARLRDPESG
jgi:hypothetical protein